MMNDKTLGYILMLLILLLSAGAVSYYFVLTGARPETRVLRFPEVGSLAIEDPVRMEGTLVGVITGFEHDSLGRVLVYVQPPRTFPLLDKKDAYPSSIPIRTSSRAAVKVKGLMGERFIEVSVGNLSDPLISADQVIDGVFEMGPSEAITYMDLLNEKIIELRDIMLGLRDGREGERSFVVAFNDIIGTVDTLVYNLITGLTGMEDDLNEGIGKAVEVVDKTSKLVGDVSEIVPGAIDDISGLIVKIDELMPKLENIIVKVESFADKVDENKLLWGDHAERIEKTLIEIRRIVEDFRREGMPLRVKLKFF
jgi:ABC-type transporter Mla subunit MlaD